MADFRHNEERLEKLLAVAALVQQTGRLREAEHTLASLRARFAGIMTLPEEVAGATFPYLFVAAKARELTRADGAALALDEGVGMLCVARAGDVAPEIGAELDINSGLSGECVRSGQTLRCDDTETDERVSRVASRELGVRSMLVAPVEHEGKICGILEVFSRQANAFQPDDALVLQFLARQVRVKRTPLPQELPPAPRFRVVIATQRTAVWAATALLLGVLGLSIWLLWPQSPASANAATAPADPGSALRQAAARGDAQAQFELAMQYASGSQAPANSAAAQHWFTAAAEQGHIEAQRFLSVLFYEGSGGQERDPVRAFMWASVAAARGDETSRNRLALLRSLVSPEQITRGQRLADDWLKAHPPTTAQ